MWKDKVFSYKNYSVGAGVMGIVGTPPGVVGVGVGRTGWVGVGESVGVAVCPEFAEGVGD